jgi:ABC-type oligopeptide transport system ATPase subunit
MLEVKNLKKYFLLKRSLFAGNNFIKNSSEVVKAVDDVSFEIPEGKTLALIGESGSGKSTVGRCIIRLLQPDEGSIYWCGENILNADRRSLGREFQIIFQDPFTSLNPRQSVGGMLKEVISYHKLCKGDEIRRRAEELMEIVGLDKNDLSRFPHEFSGGQRQRIVIARALALNPQFIICDEPVSALDVSVQAQILNLLISLQKEYSLTYLFISHDLAVVRQIADFICIMQKGKIVESGSPYEIYNSPKEEYTKKLLDSIPGKELFMMHI